MGECPNLLFQICSSKSLRKSRSDCEASPKLGYCPSLLPGPFHHQQTEKTTEALTSGGNGPESSGARNDGLGMLGWCVEWLKGKGSLEHLGDLRKSGMKTLTLDFLYLEGDEREDG